MTEGQISEFIQYHQVCAKQCLTTVQLPYYEIGRRLSIARALLKNAPVLILDEATAYADSENEVLIQQALANLCQGRTVLMIAHRLHTVIAAQRIVVLDQGRVRGIGRHEQLLESCELYRQLWQDHTRIRQWQLSSGAPA